MTANITLDNTAPIPLSAKFNTAGQLRVFHGTTEVVLLDDVFPQNTALTNVAVVVNNDAGVAIEVQFDTDPRIPVGVRGMASQTMMMPEAGACDSMHVTVFTETQSHDPIIRLKRKLGGVTPTCTAATPKRCSPTGRARKRT